MTPRGDVTVLVVAAALVAVWTASVAWRHREDRGARYLGVLMVASTWAAVATLGGFTADGLAEIRFWRQVRQIGYIGIAPAFFLFTAEYAGLDRFTTRRVHLTLVAVGVSLAAVVATTHLHGQFYGAGTYLLVDGVPRGDFQRGPLYWVHVGYAYLLVAAGTVLVIRRAIRTRRLFRRQAAAVVTFVLVPWAANVVAVAAPTAVLFDPTIVAVPFGGAFLAVGVYRYRVLDAAPVARDAVLDHLDDGVLVVDTDGRLVDYNATMEPYLRPDPVGEQFDDVVPEALDGVLAVTADGGKETVPLSADGEHRSFDVRRTALTDTADDTVARILLFRDVTERRRREEDLRRRNAELDRFASVVSHDLRNPLNVAEGYLELAAASGEREDFDRVADAHERMEAIIDDLLALAQTDDPELERVSLADAARTAWSHVATGEATLDVDADRAIRADSGRLSRLFENLFRNSVEHGGERVTVTVEAGDDWFAVSDDGPGLPPDIVETAFESGTTGSDGTGLGLAIVRSIATAHGWTVEVDETAAGARFVVRGVEQSSVVDPFDGGEAADGDTTIRND